MTEDSRIEIPFGSTLEEAELIVIKTTLARCGGNKTHAAKILGIAVKSIYNRICAADHAYVDFDTPQVYCARDDHRALVKIGWSRSPEGRIKSLTGASGVVLRLVGSINLSSGGRAREMEALLHAQFAKFKQASEWFDDANEQVSAAFVKRFCPAMRTRTSA